MALTVIRCVYGFVFSLMAQRVYEIRFNPNVPLDQITQKTLRDFVESQAKKMGIEKEISIVHGKYRPYSNSVFSNIVIRIPVEENEKILEFKITRLIAQAQSNDEILTKILTLAASFFTSFVLCEPDTVKGYLFGLGVAILAYAVLNRRAQKNADLTAMRFCSKSVNRAVLERLLEQKRKEEPLQGLIMYKISYFTSCSLDEQIEYFRAHTGA
jgi:hypothetical protein